MRWLFLIVLFLNLAYMVWQTTRPVTQSYEDVRPLKNVRPIVLLSELKQQPSPQIGEVVETAEAVKTEVAEIASVNKSEQIKQSALTLDKDNIVAEIKPLKTPDELQEKPLMSRDGRYFARSQEGDAIMSRDGRPDSPYGARSQEGGAMQKESCFTLGPFRDLDKLRELTRDIKAYVVTTDFRGREERQQDLYWVYIKPETNRKKALEVGKRLKAKKIKDFYVVRKGEKIHGVSLGRFRNKNGAYGLAKKVKKLGFDVVVEPVFKTYTVYWLDYQLADGVSIPEALLEQYTDSTKKGKISRLSRSCGT